MTLSIDYFTEGGYGVATLADGATTERKSAVLNVSGIDLSAGNLEVWRDGSLWFTIAAADLPTWTWFVAFLSGSHTFQLKQYDVTNSTYIATSNVFTIVSAPTNATASESSTYFTEDFTDANGTALSAHTASGITWSKYTTTGGPFYNVFVTGLISAYTIDTNELVQAGTAGTVCRVQPSVDPATSNYFYEAAFNTGSSTYSGTNPQLDFGFVAQTPSGDSSYCGVEFIIYRNSSSLATNVRYTINMWRNGSVFKTLDDAAPGAPFSFVVGAHTARVEFQSRYVRFYIDGVCLLDTRDLYYGTTNFLGDGLVLSPVTPGNVAIRAQNSSTTTIALDSLRAGALAVSIVGDVTEVHTGAFGPIGLANTVVPLRTGTFGARETFCDVTPIVHQTHLPTILYAFVQRGFVTGIHTGILPTLIGPLYAPPDLRQFGNVRTLRTRHTATMTWAGSVAGGVTAVQTGQLPSIGIRERQYFAVTGVQTGAFGAIALTTRHSVASMRTCHFGPIGVTYRGTATPVHRVHLGGMKSRAIFQGAVSPIHASHLPTFGYLGGYHVRTSGRTGKLGRMLVKRNPEC